jgi:uncharacterized protein (DUF2267 family)
MTVGSPARSPVKLGSREYVRRFARDAGIEDTDVPPAASVVTRMVRRHVSAGALDEALHAFSFGLRQLIEPIDARERAGGAR